MKSYRLLAFLLALSVIVPVVSNAQAPPRSLAVHLQDSVFASRLGPGGDTVAPDFFWAAYSFENTYGDSGNVFFLFTEAKVNSQRIALHDWIPWQFIKDSTAEGLSGISRTRPFTVIGGDTISYYRQFSWQRPADVYLQLPNNFYSADTLEYVIRLRKASNGMELAVLDSVGVLSQVPAGSPTFYGTGFPMGITEYVIPGTVPTGTSVYLSIDVRAKGNGDYYTCRSDQVTGRMSDAVTDPVLAGYFSELLGLSPKSISQRLEEVRGKTLGEASLRILPNPSTSGDVRITVSSAGSGERRSIMIFSTSGKVVYSYSTVSAVNELEIIATVADAGSYYVAYTVGDNIVSVDLLNVVR